MIKEAQSKQEKDIIGRYIKQITQKLTEQDALILKYLRNVATQSQGESSGEKYNVTVRGIADATKIDIFAVRRCLDKLDAACFVDKGKGRRRTLIYTITDDGAHALNYLMSNASFPGRREKFEALLAGKGGTM